MSYSPCWLVCVGLALTPCFGLTVAGKIFDSAFDHGCQQLVNITTGGFADEHGNPMEFYNESSTWGITQAKCYEFCSREKLGLVSITFIA